MSSGFTQPIACLVTLVALFSVAGCGGSDDTAALEAEVKQAENIRHPKARTDALVKVAAKQREQGDAAGANNSINKAMAACEQIADDADQARARCSVAVALFDAKRKNEAEELIKQVRDSYDQIEDAYDKVEVVSAMAAVFGTQMDDARRGEAYLKDVEDEAQSIENPVQRAKATGLIAVAYHRIDVEAEAQRLVDEMLTAARAIDDLRDRNEATLFVARQLRNMGKTSESNALFDEAKSLIDRIEPALSRGYALITFAEACKQTGQASRGKAALAEANSVAGKADEGLKKELVEAINKAEQQL